MSNSFVNVHAGEETGDEAKRYFVLGERIERRLRIRGNWLISSTSPYHQAAGRRDMRMRAQRCSASLRDA